MTKSCFITGTDTGVGKSVVTAGIAGLLARQGKDVGVMKPIATGTPRASSRFKSDDVERLADAIRTNDPEEMINPVFLPIAASPLDACRILDTQIDIDSVFENFKKLQQNHQFLFVEGIGGIMTPITESFFVADMIKKMETEVIIVTRSTLGTLNHTVMTCHMCKSYGIDIKGIVINGYDEYGPPAEKNAPITLHKITGQRILGTLPFIKDLEGVDEIIDKLNRNIDLECLL